jgi:hypothetical protein
MGDNIRYKLVPAASIEKTECRTSRKADGWKFNKKYSYVKLAKHNTSRNYWNSKLFNKARAADHNLAQQMNVWYATSYASPHRNKFNVVIKL